MSPQTLQNTVTFIDRFTDGVMCLLGQHDLGACQMEIPWGTDRAGRDIYICGQPIVATDLEDEQQKCLGCLLANHPPSQPARRESLMEMERRRA